MGHDDIYSVLPGFFFHLWSHTCVINLTGLINLCSRPQQILKIMPVVNMYGMCVCQLFHQHRDQRKNKFRIQESHISPALNLLS